MPNISKSTLQHSKYILYFLLLLIMPCSSLLSNLIITTNDTIINKQSTHTFKIYYTNSIARSSFTLYFPSCVNIINNPTVTNINNTILNISNINNNINNTSNNISSISFNLPFTISSTLYIFNINNIINCYHAGTFRNQSFAIYNNADNIIENYGAMPFVYYTPGTLSNCNIRFDGNTGDIASKAHIQFNIANTVYGIAFVVQLQYSTYFSSNVHLTTYNTLSNVPTCGLYVNNTLFINSIPATFSTNSQLLTCTFPSYISNIYDDIKLQIANIANPITSTIYATNTQFILTTLDNNGFSYDISNVCTIMPVNIVQHNAIFTTIDYINGQMYPLQIKSINNIGIRIARYDQITINYTSGTFSNCVSSIIISRSATSTITPINCTQVPSNTPNTFIYRATSANSQNYTININFVTCYFNLPPSTLPITFNLLFAATDSNGVTGVYDNYMLINAVLEPLPAPIDTTQLNLTLSSYVIGDSSAYTFDFVTAQPLTSNPAILIQFPSQINVVSANSTLSSCTVSINNAGVGSKYCQLILPNSLRITITNSNPIPAASLISITITNIVNPSIPTYISGISLTTIYTSSQLLGISQYGSNITNPILYTPRTVYPTIVDNNYTVYNNGSMIVLSYTVGVDIPNGSMTRIAFNNVLKYINYMSVNLNSNVVLSSYNNGIYLYTLNNVLAGTTILFTFTCLTPAATGTYPILSLLTYHNAQIYQQTVNNVTINIIQPYINIFTVTLNPLYSITGVTTDYTYFFNTTVPHTLPFYLQITFASGTQFINGQSLCTLGCSNSTINDLSSGNISKIRVLINSTQSGCSTCYQIRINMIINQRTVGTTPQFIFTTLVQDRTQLIITGTATATINKYNTLIAQFSTTDDYYHSNTNPINIILNVTNILQANDYILIQFDTTTSYSLQSNTTNIQCAIGTCTSNTINNILYIKIIPSASQIISSVLSISLQGLISNPSTPYNTSIAIPIGTYNASGNAIDKSYLYYSVSCGNNISIISKNCKTCAYINNISVCTSCYTPLYSLYNNTQCTNTCGNLSKYQTYPLSGICISCIIPCYTCYNQTYCTSCILPYYLYTDGNLCSSSCNTSSSYYIYNNTLYLQCRKCTTNGCASCPNDICVLCISPGVLQAGQCIGLCPAGSYNAGGLCKPCHAACSTCSGGSNSQCIVCNIGYYNVSGACISSCPTGTVSYNNACICSGECATCINSTSTCLSCTNPLLYYYQYKCIPICPSATYPIGRQCYNCVIGCISCTSTTCMQCSIGYSISQNACYSNCKVLGISYTSMYINNISTCIQCPNGCLQCNQLYQCTQCISNYVLTNTTCIQQCQINNTCNIYVKTQTIVPLPATIAIAVWIIIIIIVKIFIVKHMYAPYAVLFVGAVMYFVELIVMFAVTFNTINTINTFINNNNSSNNRLLQYIQYSDSSRLLQTQTYTYTSLPSYLSIVAALLATSIAINYILNLSFLILFCKRIRQLISQRQIDIISNYCTLIVSILTSYRFYLLAFSRLFKQPFIQINQQSKLKPIHIILSISYVTDIITIVASIILIINSIKYSILYMLSIDIIIIIVILWVVFVYALVKGKPDEYYSYTKKYRFQEHYITQQASLHNNININNTNVNVNQISKIKLNSNNVTNQKLHIQDISDDSNNNNIDQLPTLQPNMLKVVPKNMQRIQDIDKKTKRKYNNNSKNNNINNNIQVDNDKSNKKFFNNKQDNDSNNNNNLSSRNKLQNEKSIKSMNPNSKISKGHARNQSQTVMKINKQKIGIIKKQQQYQFQQDNDNSVKFEKQLNNQQFNKNEQQFIKKSIKHKQQVNINKMPMKVSQSASVMKKNKKIGLYQSQAAQSYIDQVDLQSIIQTRMIDRTKEKKKGDGSQRAKTQAGQNDKTMEQQMNDEISPSWFNIPNQRYDIDDGSIQ